ncbi:hypothetical protein B0H14DRAFT_2631742 [Mycena olivaceomarginata]|nr:hypothetical protein B0H14DRAFT_2631742 [Mycena olivaceomarginata]
MAFTGDLCKLYMPHPADCVDFEDVRPYICPVPMGNYTLMKVVLGTVSYPQGVSFGAECTAFGKKGTVAGFFGSGGVKLVGSVYNFRIGPLSVHSASGAPSASLNIELGQFHQHIMIDGISDDNGRITRLCATHVIAKLMKGVFPVWRTVLGQVAELLNWPVCKLGSLGGRDKGGQHVLHLYLGGATHGEGRWGTLSSSYPRLIKSVSYRALITGGLKRRHRGKVGSSTLGPTRAVSGPTLPSISLAKLRCESNPKQNGLRLTEDEWVIRMLKGHFLGK